MKTSKILGLVAFVCCGYLHCEIQTNGSNKKSGQSNNTQNDIVLEYNLATPGTVVTFATTGSEHIKGEVTDTDGDDNGDGIDLDGNISTIEMVYINGTLDLKSSSRDDHTLAFYFSSDSEQTLFYLIADETLTQIPRTKLEAILQFLF